MPDGTVIMCGHVLVGVFTCVRWLETEEHDIDMFRPVLPVEGALIGFVYWLIVEYVSTRTFYRHLWAFARPPDGKIDAEAINCIQGWFDAPPRFVRLQLLN